MASIKDKSTPQGSSTQYCIRYEGNNSKRWDGKVIWIDASVLDELYDETELTNGSHVVVPWKGKGNKISHWKAVLVDPACLMRQGIEKTLYMAM